MNKLSIHRTKVNGKTYVSLEDVLEYINQGAMMCSNPKARTLAFMIHNALSKML